MLLEGNGLQSYAYIFKVPSQMLIIVRTIGVAQAASRAYII